jgi:hypothetical protein
VSIVAASARPLGVIVFTQDHAGLGFKFLKLGLGLGTLRLHLVPGQRELLRRVLNLELPAVLFVAFLSACYRSFLLPSSPFLTVRKS